MRANTITKALGGAGAHTKRRIVPGGILALSLAVVLSAAMASSASADVALATSKPYGNCPPLPPPPTTVEQIPEGCFWPIGWFDFGYHVVGTSTSQRFALGVREETSFNPRIGVSGDYTQTNSCPPTLSAGADPQIDVCLITVTFTPTGEGPRPGTMTTGPGGPTMGLTGTGEPRDSVPPDLQLSGPKKQNPQDDYPGCDGHECNLKLKVSCGDEACTARAKGRLTNVKLDKLSSDPTDIAPGETTQQGPELRSGVQRKQVRKALRNGKNVQAKVTVRAMDTSGNVATAKRTITLVKSTKQGFKKRFDAVK